MTKVLLIAYEPALFGLAVLGWAAWEFWSMRTRKGDAPSRPSDDGGADPPPRGGS